MRFLLRLPVPQSLSHFIGRKLFRFLLPFMDWAFALITLGVILTKFRKARRLIWPLIFHETSRAGLRLLPMFLFIAQHWACWLSAKQYLVDPCRRH